MGATFENLNVERVVHTSPTFYIHTRRTTRLPHQPHASPLDVAHRVMTVLTGFVCASGEAHAGASHIVTTSHSPLKMNSLAIHSHGYLVTVDNWTSFTCLQHSTCVLGTRDSEFTELAGTLWPWGGGVAGETGWLFPKSANSTFFCHCAGHIFSLLQSSFQTTCVAQ